MYIIFFVYSYKSDALNSLPDDGCVQNKISRTVEDDLERTDQDIIVGFKAIIQNSKYLENIQQYLDGRDTHILNIIINSIATIQESTDSTFGMIPENETTGLDDAQDQDQGPEQGGATGIPISEQDDIVEDYVNQPVNVPYDEMQALRETFNLNDGSNNNNSDSPINWPQQGEKPLSDYDTPGLQSLAFPFLFHKQQGDITIGDRAIRIDKVEAAQHLLWYAIKRPEENGGGYYYPFAAHPKWCYWMQNTIERHRIHSQKKIYFKRNPEDLALTADDIQKIIDTEDVGTIKDLLSNMQMYSANLPGSDAYFSKHKRELESCMDHKKMITVWMTGSMADNHWLDLHIFSHIPLLDSDNEADRVKKRRKWVRENQHFVDHYFCLRIQAMLKLYMGKNFSLKTIWQWIRYEYQMRGTIHGHGCARLASDTGIIVMAQEVAEGKFAQRLLSVYDADKALIDKLASDEKFTDEEMRIDEWQPLDLIHKGAFPISSFEGDADYTYKYWIEKIKTGKQASIKIIKYNDYIVSTWHPEPPSDAGEIFRHPTTKFEQFSNNQHPSNINMFLSKTREEEQEEYINMINCFQRHDHGPYCNKKYWKPENINDMAAHIHNNSYCRSDFARYITSKTMLKVRELKSGRRVLELITACNDGWLNPHNRPILTAHRANMDFRLIIDVGKVMGYMTKYVTKTESAPNNRSKRLLMSVFKRATKDNPTIDKILTRLMSQVSTFFVFSLLSEIYYGYCTHSKSILLISCFLCLGLLLRLLVKDHK